MSISKKSSGLSDAPGALPRRWGVPLGLPPLRGRDGYSSLSFEGIWIKSPKEILLKEKTYLKNS
jgi:hypothetical protein